MTFAEYRGGAYLSHHGIEGQQWGERNGPPYPLGSGSGGKGRGNRNNKPQSSQTNYPNDRHREYKKDDYLNMTSAELDRAIERVQKENQYREVMEVQERQLSLPSEIRKKRVEEIGWKAAGAFAEGGAKEAGKQVVKGITAGVNAANTATDIAYDAHDRYRQHRNNKYNNKKDKR